jgi:hypothetical protein
MQKAWRNEAELAELLIARGYARKSVRLTADTALFVGLKLRLAAAKPTHAEIVRMVCDRQCEKGCTTCVGKANVIVAAYGHSIGAPKSRG